jgi:hypothetical protein
MLEEKKIINEIDNKEILEMLGSYAFSLLEKGKDYENLDGLQCTFGYCITGVNGELESLYKIITDKTIVYFQAINGKVVRLTIDEEKYLYAVNFLFNNNPSIKNRKSHTMIMYPNSSLKNNEQQLYSNNQIIQPISNSQNLDSAYKLVLTRPKNFVGSLIKFKIYIDGYELGTIKNGETVVLNVNSGNHIISFNKKMDQSINISGDTSADVVHFGGNNFGLSNIRNNSGNV